MQKFINTKYSTLKKPCHKNPLSDLNYEITNWMHKFIYILFGTMIKISIGRKLTPEKRNLTKS